MSWRTGVGSPEVNVSRTRIVIIAIYPPVILLNLLIRFIFVI